MPLKMQVVQRWKAGGEKRASAGTLSPLLIMITVIAESLTFHGHVASSMQSLRVALISADRCR